MNKQERYLANFVINNEIVLQIHDNDKNKLIARATELLESAFNDAVCEIIDSDSNISIQTLKRNSIE